MIMSFKELFREKYSGDNLVSIATVDSDGVPWVRTVNATFYRDSFFAVTQASSTKIQHISLYPKVAVSGDWFSVHGIAENLGSISLPDNSEYAAHIRSAFADWYENGDINESDPDMVILRIRLTDGVIWHNGERIPL